MCSHSLVRESVSARNIHAELHDCLYNVDAYVMCITYVHVSHEYEFIC